ncbi:hypothetical protein [Bacillus salipaludis]|uniref:Uncharacterized protein n=1 Tax=Bacillus salipaludis TaxID=2547811 RepID=A0AA90TTA4_9BACI|nr:hypothetical protein [Bacillus salipaludis]MDQ6597164.1 hypothetical protein [Bacillus salipaludis]
MVHVTCFLPPEAADSPVEDGIEADQFLDPAGHFAFLVDSICVPAAAIGVIEATAIIAAFVVQAHIDTVVHKDYSCTELAELNNFHKDTSEHRSFIVEYPINM